MSSKQPHWMSPVNCKAWMYGLCLKRAFLGGVQLRVHYVKLWCPLKGCQWLCSQGSGSPRGMLQRFRAQPLTCTRMHQCVRGVIRVPKINSYHFQPEPYSNCGCCKGGMLSTLAHHHGASILAHPGLLISKYYQGMKVLVFYVHSPPTTPMSIRGVWGIAVRGGSRVLEQCCSQNWPSPNLELPRIATIGRPDLTLVS